jgi:hypothetical protein
MNIPGFTAEASLSGLTGRPGSRRFGRMVPPAFEAVVPQTRKVCAEIPGAPAGTCACGIEDDFLRQSYYTGVERHPEGCNNPAW